MKRSALARGSGTRIVPASLARAKYPASSRNARRGGVSCAEGSNGSSSEVRIAFSRMATTIREERMPAMKGTTSSATRRRTTRGSVFGSMCASSRIEAGGSSGSPAVMASANNASFDLTCRRIAAGVTPSAAPISASVASLNPRLVKTPLAFSRISERVIRGGRPIV
jgi:hypothetical protein